MGDLRLTDEMKQRILSRVDRALQGYYIGFDPTGNESIDLILSLLISFQSGRVGGGLDEVWLFIFTAAVSAVGTIIELRLRYWTWRHAKTRAALEGEAK